MVSTNATEVKEVTGKLEAMSSFQQCGTAVKKGFKVGDDWYNLIGSEESINKLTEGLKNGDEVTIGYKVKPYAAKDGSQRTDLQVQSIVPAGFAEAAKDADAEKTEPRREIPRLGATKDEQIRRLALLKAASACVMKVDTVGEPGVEAVADAVICIAERLELWVVK